jgi:hypothetical protein
MAQLKTSQDQRSSYTWATVPTHEVNGVAFADSEALMELMDELVEEDRELLDRLAQQ